MFRSGPQTALAGGARLNESSKEASMKITSIKTYHHRHKLPRAIGCSTLLYNERDALLIKISTDEGLVGWGETALLGGLRDLIENQLGSALMGQDPRRHRALWRQLWGANFGNALAVA